jgi:NitT/TauT family transport system substrate-binding protein
VSHRDTQPQALPRRISIRRQCLLLAALALTGCGPRSENSAAGTPGANAGTAGSPVTVRLAFFPNVTHGVALVGTGDGTFARALGPNVRVEEQIYSAGPSEIEALFGDQVDIGYIGPGPAVNGFLKSQGRALRIVAGASSGGTALVVRKDAGIADIKGLSGKRVAVPQTGGTQDISLRHALQGAGLNSTDRGGTVSVMPTTPADTLTLFVKKEIDAAWVTEPWASRLVNEGSGQILIDERDLWPDKRFATTVVIVRTKFLQAHSDLVSRFLDAHVQTVAWIGNNRETAQKVIGKRIQDLMKKALPDDILAAALSRTDFTYDPLPESVLTFADYAKALGYQKDDRGALSSLMDLKPLNAVLAQRKLPAIQ